MGEIELVMFFHESTNPLVIQIVPATKYLTAKNISCPPSVVITTAYGWWGEVDRVTASQPYEGGTAPNFTSNHEAKPCITPIESEGGRGHTT